MGIKQDKMSRPENCEGLITVQTNQMIWDVLYPLTKTNDTKMKNLQTIIIKSATLVTKVIDKLDTLCEKSEIEGLSDVVDDAMDCLALMGHVNHKLCLTRREYMTPDANEKYSYLFNEYTHIDKMLFGGDVSKRLTDIGICNRISRKIQRGGIRSGFGYESWQHIEAVVAQYYLI